MTVRHSRNWLRAARSLALSGAALAFTLTARAQSAPIPSPPTAPGGDAQPPSAPTTAQAPAAAPAPLQPTPETAQPVQTEPSAALGVDVEAAADANEHKKKKGKKEDEDGKSDKKKGGKKRDRNASVRTAAGRIQLKGRVFALAELEHQRRTVITGATVGLRGVDSLDFSVASARVGLEYEAPVRWISAVAELELTGKPSLKDGYVQARGQNFFARMGQFKLPVSELETESPWNLPLARRGLVHTLLTDWLDVGGRRPGVMVGWRGRGGLHPRFMLGAFQGSTLADTPSAADRNTDLIVEKSLEAQSYVARAQLEAVGIQLGAWYEHRVGSRDLNETKHYFTAGADATVDHVLPTGGVRAWVEGTTGASWYEHVQKPADNTDAIFIEGRALVGYRFGGTVDEAVYVEPFGFFGVLEPDTEVRRDLAWEAALGVNAGFWRRARLTLQGEINRAQRNFPAGYLVDVEPDRMSLLLQAGVAW